MNYREQRSYLNCEKRIFDGVGEYDIPRIRADKVDMDGAELLAFNFAKSEKHPENKIVHFFLDDYQFDRVWNKPDVYVHLLSKFRAVVSPDFSVYTDFPHAVNLFNYYRKHWLAAYWQMHGIKVIPSINRDDRYDWWVDGEPTGTLVCVSTVGNFKSIKMANEYRSWWKHMVEALKPSGIIIHGKQWEGLDFDGKVYVFPNGQIERKRSLVQA